jgi:hypothetical protein
VCLAIRDAEPERFERTALRWMARFCLGRSDATPVLESPGLWTLDRWVV